jgi:predicted permease
MVGVGFLFARVTKLRLEPLIDIIIYITTPCLVFTSIVNSEFVLREFLDIALGSGFVILGGGLLVFIASRIRKFDPRAFYLPVIFPNTGNMGLSVSLFAFGAVGLSRGIIYYVVSCILFYSLGIYLVNRSRNTSRPARLEDRQSTIKTTLKIPVIYVAIIGITLSIYRQPLLQVLGSHPVLLEYVRIGAGTIAMLARPTIPLMLLVLGYRLARTRILSFRLPIVCALARIVVGFCLALIFVSCFRVTGLNRAIIILISSLSSPVASFMLAQKFDARPEVAAAVILLSTLFMIVTIPLLLVFLN